MARRRLWALALAGVVLVACGSGDPPPPPPPAPGDPAAAPATPPAPTDPATPTDPVAPPSAPASPPPTTPAACEGLVPDAPGPGVQYTRDIGRAVQYASCLSPVTDGRGEWIGVGIAPGRHEYDFVSAAAPGAPVAHLSLAPNPYGGPDFAPQPDGHHAVQATAGPGRFQRYDAKGALLSDDAGAWALAIEGVPRGGSVVLAAEAGVHRLVWLSAAGERRAAADTPASTAFAISSNGNVLAFAAGQARWYDGDGAPLTAWFPFGERSGAWYARVLSSAVALADGSVVVGLRDADPLRFEQGSTSFAPPPEWVTSRSGATIAAVRGNRANAFATVETGGSAACTVRIEILTPSGESCGTTRLEAPSPCQFVAFGADRTVVTTGQAFTGPKVGICSWHWWSGLLR